MADSVETLGVDLRTRVRKLGAKEEMRRKRCKLRFSIIKKKNPEDPKFSNFIFKKPCHVSRFFAFPTTRGWHAVLTLFPRKWQRGIVTHPLSEGKWIEQEILFYHTLSGCTHIASTTLLLITTTLSQYHVQTLKDAHTPTLNHHKLTQTHSHHITSRTRHAHHTPHIPHHTTHKTHTHTQHTYTKSHTHKQNTTTQTPRHNKKCFKLKKL